jgi:exo-1,4-beta-D-glucosaminidase
MTFGNKLLRGLACALLPAALVAPGAQSLRSLNTGWKLQSGCVAKVSGELISSRNYLPEGWINAVIPGTVLGSQIEAGLFPDPFFGMNLRQIPGTDYPIGKIFGYLPMSNSSPYHCSWWYRTEFSNPVEPGRSTWLHFDGINYSANIWLNGKQIASRDQISGAFRSYDFDVSDDVDRGKTNVLAVEVFAQTEKDLGIDFLDWNPAPADKSMGIWRDVSLRTTGPVTIANPAVTTHFVKDDLSDAELRVVVDVANHFNHPVRATVTATVGTIFSVEQSIELAASEAREVYFEPEKFAQLHWKNPPVWWPYQYGSPHLERLRVTATVDHVESDEKTIRFGIREAQASLNEHGFLQFQINHRSILIRGGGWAPDLFYREPKERLRQELSLVKHMNLNSIRLEGKLGSDGMFDLADEMGILVLAGWQCCDYWQQWEKWTPNDHQIANASMHSQISRLRSHPSVIAWLNGSDEIPAPEVEKGFLTVLKERDWPNPVLSSAADRTSSITGKSGVKMTGPYDFVPPEYWYLDKNRFGGAYGFNMETSPGPAIPSVATIHKTLPRQSWWPIDDEWKYHAGLGKFAQYNNFNSAMAATYGQATSLDNYSLKAQLMAYDSERAMFESYGANKYASTGVIQWMLNNAWPSFLWHLYDYSLIPGGGYFGTRKANEPLHIQYRYDDRKIVIVNSTLETYKDLRVTAKVVTLDGKQIFINNAVVDVAVDGVGVTFALPAQSATTFVKLELHDHAGRLMSENFYWVPTQLAQLDWNKSTYVNTPAIRYADMRDLASIQSTQVKVSARKGPQPGEIAVEVQNRESSVAFFLHLRAVKTNTDEEIAPVFWDDNFISLLPGETKVLTVRGLPVNNTDIDIKLDGWNVSASTMRLE